jgi:hypothetical protein
MSYTSLLKIVPTLQATALVGRNLKLVKKKKKRAKDFLSAGTDTIVGSSLIQAESGFLYD